jgi:hypothetical protein
MNEIVQTERQTIQTRTMRLSTWPACETSQAVADRMGVSMSDVRLLVCERLAQMSQIKQNPPGGAADSAGAVHGVSIHAPRVGATREMCGGQNDTRERRKNQV